MKFSNTLSVSLLALSTLSLAAPMQNVGERDALARREDIEPQLYERGEPSKKKQKTSHDSKNNKEPKKKKIQKASTFPIYEDHTATHGGPANTDTYIYLEDVADYVPDRDNRNAGQGPHQPSGHGQENRQHRREESDSLVFGRGEPSKKKQKTSHDSKNNKEPKKKKIQKAATFPIYEDHTATHGGPANTDTYIYLEDVADYVPDRDNRNAGQGPHQPSGHGQENRPHRREESDSQVFGRGEPSKKKQKTSHDSKNNKEPKKKKIQKASTFPIYEDHTATHGGPANTDTYIYLEDAADYVPDRDNRSAGQGPHAPSGHGQENRH